MTLAQIEREALANLFDQVGPDHPTLDEGWLTRDLLVHLLIRERRPDAALGMVIKPLSGWTAKVERGFAELPWAQQVNLFRHGPPRLSIAGIPGLDAVMNGMEHFIHHEDVRRGKEPWEPRKLDEQTTEQIIKMLTSFPMSFAFKKLKTGITVRLPDGRTLTVADGEPRVVLHGEPAEILLWVSGRRTACRVEVKGEDAALRHLESAIADN